MNALAQSSFLRTIFASIPPGDVPALLGRRGYELPDVGNLRPVRAGDPPIQNLTIRSASDSNVLWVPTDYAPPHPIRLFFHDKASNNTVVCGQKTQVYGDWKVAGTNNLAIFCGREPYASSVTLGVTGDNNTFYWGHGSSSNGLTIYIPGTAQSVILGEDCMAAQRSSIMASDQHALVDIETEEWLNPPSSVLLEPHVWLGWESMIMKGVTVGIGSTVAARAIVTRNVDAFCIAAGMPAKIVRRGSAWLRPGVPKKSELEKLLKLRDEIALDRAAFAETDEAQ